jgi:hypothetical protein
MINFWEDGPVQEGDLVSSKGADKAKFTVIAIHEDKCWIQDVSTGDDLIVEVSACAPWRTRH